MSFDRAEIMQTAWTNARDLLVRFSYAPHQLRDVFRVELIRAWHSAKAQAALAARSIESLETEIISLENQTFQGHEGRERLTILKRALDVARNAAAEKEYTAKRELIAASVGRFASVTFTKKDGTRRVMRVQPAAAKQHVVGEAASEAAQKAIQTRAKRHPHLLPVWDVEARAFRSVNLATVSRIAVNGAVHEY